MTPTSQIDGVGVWALRVIGDERGCVMHMLRADAPGFERFGEVYFSEVAPGVTKGWKRHARTTQHLAVPIGRVRFILYDGRETSETHGRIEAHDLGRPDAYRLLRIPPGVWYGWRSTSDTPALVANCIDAPYDPGETNQVDELEALRGVSWNEPLFHP